MRAGWWSCSCAAGGGVGVVYVEIHDIHIYTRGSLFFYMLFFFLFFFVLYLFVVKMIMAF